MIKEVTMFSLFCDNCGKDLLEDTEFAGYDEKGFLLEIAKESDWQTLVGGFLDEVESHYCPDCYEYDDNDELVIRKK